jgi:hypothetical protein
LGQFQTERPEVRANPDAGIAAMLAASSQPGLLAATDVLGRLAYYAGHVPILDMAGLTDAHIAKHGDPRPPFGRSDFDYVMARRPHLMMNNVAAAWLGHLNRQDFTEGYWWADRPVWTRPDAARARPRFVFVRRGTVLESEFRRCYPDAVFRDPRAIGRLRRIAIR